MPSAKILVVYYSRTGNTRRLAQSIARELHCDVEEIREARARLGIIGYLKSCFEALRRHHAPIQAAEHDPKSYDLIVIGTPVWTASVSTPVRAYLREHRQSLPDVAFFCTMGHRGSSGAFSAMEKLARKPPRASCALTAAAVAGESLMPSVAKFVAEIGCGEKAGPGGVLAGKC